MFFCLMCRFRGTYSVAHRKPSDRLSILHDNILQNIDYTEVIVE